MGAGGRVGGAGALRIRRTDRGVVISVRVQPRSSRNEIVGVLGESLKVRVTAPPVDGAANEALIDLLKSTFRIPSTAITIVSGSSSRTKIVELAGVTEDRVRQLVQP